jgi:hypothetical protein
VVPGLLSLLLLPLFLVPLFFFFFFNTHYNDTPFALLPFTIVFLPFTLIRQARQWQERDLLFLLTALSRTETRERIWKVLEQGLSTLCHHGHGCFV